MQINLQVKNIVFVGNFAITLYDKYFFIKNNIVSESEILAGSDFTPFFTQLLTDRFTIVLNPGQIIISSNKFGNQENEIVKIISILLNAKTFGVITALGFNFHWYLDTENQAIEEISKKYFYNDKVKIFTEFFNGNDAMFGAYASVNYKDSRLKLDIKPNKLHFPDKDSTKDLINFSFNFHFDIKKSHDSSEIQNYLNDYSSYQLKSEEIIKTYTND